MRHIQLLMLVLVLATASSLPSISEASDKIILRSAREEIFTQGLTPFTTVAAPVKLGTGPTIATLLPAGMAGRIRSFLQNLDPKRKNVFIIRLNNVTLSADPKTNYDIYLDLPPNVQAADRKYYKIGVLNLSGQKQEPAATRKSYDYDVTMVMARLVKLQTVSLFTTVTFVPTATLDEKAEPQIANGIEFILN